MTDYLVDARVPCGKFASQIAEDSVFLARRDDEGLAGLIRVGATLPGTLRTGEVGSELTARDPVVEKIGFQTLQCGLCKAVGSSSELGEAGQSD